MVKQHATDLFWYFWLQCFWKITSSSTSKGTLSM